VQGGEPKCTKAGRVHKVGGPESPAFMIAEDVPAPDLARCISARHAVGLNFIDVYYRNRLYKAPGCSHPRA